MVFLSGNESVRLLIVCLYRYMCTVVGDPIIKRVVVIPLTGLSSPPGDEYPAAYIMVFIVFNK